MKYVNENNIKTAFESFHKAEPFHHCVIDNFFQNEVADILGKEFPSADSNVFNGNYFNQIEIKKTCNVWDRFPKTTYSVFEFLNSLTFINFLKELTKIPNLYADYGLHGGGWHLHPPGGKLNVHLDYNIHPKLELQRKFNLLVYLNPRWEVSWGGQLGFWKGDNVQPTNLVKTIEPKFNRAVIFDTTQNSWHGLEIPNTFPSNESRNSLALYYLTEPSSDTTQRNRALFAPTEEQKNDHDILELIKRRSEISTGDVSTWSRK